MEENNNTKHVAALHYELHEIKELCQRRAFRSSGTFVAKTDPDNVKWKVEFRFGTNGGYENFLSVAMNGMNAKNAKLDVFVQAYEIHVRNSAGRTMKKYKDENYIFERFESYCKPDFISFDSLRNAFNDGHISFDVWIKYSGKHLHSAFDSSDSSESSDSLQSDYLRLLHSENGADVTISLIGGKTIKAHSQILMARSSYFHGLFRSGMEKAQTKTIKVKDSEAEPFVDLLKYIYSGMIPDNLAETAIVLLPMADLYCIASLKSKCCSALIQNLTPSNAAKALILSDLHGLENLKKACMNFIKTCPKEVQSSEGWQALKDCPDLMDEVFSFIVN